MPANIQFNPKDDIATIVSKLNKLLGEIDSAVPASTKQVETPTNNISQNQQSTIVTNTPVTIQHLIQEVDQDYAFPQVGLMWVLRTVGSGSSQAAGKAMGVGLITYWGGSIVATTYQLSVQTLTGGVKRVLLT